MADFITTIAEGLTNPQALIAVGAALGTFATVVALSRPLFARDQLKSRMKSVSLERQRIRERERSRLVNGKDENGNSLRQADSKRQTVMGNIVKKFNLRTALDDGSLTNKLAMAGYRGPRPATFFLFARFILPFAFMVVAAIYIFSLGLLPEQSLTIRLGVCTCIGYLGFVLPNIILKNKTVKRQQSIQRAFPDALDLMLICVESGMSVEASFKRVAQEIGSQSPPLAEELALTTAELSFLQVRTKAYDNLASRTGLDGVKACTLALSQAEKFGTPVGSALRVMAQENRDMRMNKAEEKAASLPPKLTVPMILFFLPVLFLIIISPAIMQLYESGVF
ncbi:MAG: type II secretion system F family protein [Hyphomicrobiales bacterium]